MEGKLERDHYDRKRAQLEAALERPGRPSGLLDLTAAREALQDVPTVWEELTAAERRAFIRDAFVRIELDGPVVTVLEASEAFAPLFEADREHRFGGDYAMVERATGAIGTPGRNRTCAPDSGGRCSIP